MHPAFWLGRMDILLYPGPALWIAKPLLVEEFHSASVGGIKNETKPGHYKICGKSYLEHFPVVLCHLWSAILEVLCSRSPAPVSPAASSERKFHSCHNLPKDWEWHDHMVRTGRQGKGRPTHTVFWHSSGTVPNSVERRLLGWFHRPLFWQTCEFFKCLYIFRAVQASNLSSQSRYAYLQEETGNAIFSACITVVFTGLHSGSICVNFHQTTINFIL